MALQGPKVVIAPALVVVAILASSPALADELTLSVADVDSLRCPPRSETLHQLHERLAFDAALRSRHLQAVIAAYARLEFLTEQLEVRRKQRQNLELTHAVFLERQRRAEVSDLEVLASQGRLLESELAIADCLYRTQQTILEIADLAFLRIAVHSSPPVVEDDEQHAHKEPPR